MAVIVACALGVASAAEAAKRSAKDQIAETIVKIREGETIGVRAEAAQHLYELIQGKDVRKIDDNTVADIVALLSSSEDPVRAWIAGCIGDIGPRARAAVPRLRQILAEVECEYVALSSEPMVRRALVQLGEPEPPRPVCKR